MASQPCGEAEAGEEGGEEGGGALVDAGIEPVLALGVPQGHDGQGQPDGDAEQGPWRQGAVQPPVPTG